MADKLNNDDSRAILLEIRAEQTRQSEKLDEINHRVTGGLDVSKGLEFRTAQLEAREESRKFWMQAFGVTAVGAAFTAVGTLVSWIIKGSSSHP
jgi:hypothetical protein